MRRPFTAIVLLTLVCLRPVLADDAQQPGANAGGHPDRLRVVMLHGTADIGAWQQRFASAFLSHPGLVDHSPPFSIATEFLGVYGAEAPDERALAEALAYKQRRRPADVVVAVQEGGGFAADWAERLYPGVPVLYVLPGREVLERVEGRPGTHVLRSAIRDAIVGTVEDVPEVMPRARRLLLITGANAFDDVYHDHARRALDGVTTALEIEYVHGEPLDAVVERLAGAGPETAALVLTYEGDPAGRAYRTSVDVMPRLVATGVPLFGAYDSLLDYGAIGGVMTSTEAYGRAAAAMAVNLAHGGSTEGAAAGALRHVYDAERLVATGLSLDDVPADAELTNLEPTIWGLYGREIAIGLLVIVAQLLLIVAFARLWRQRARDARALRDQARALETEKVLFESVIDSIPAAVLLADAQGTILRVNRGFSTLFGIEREAAVGENCRVLVREGDASPLERDDAAQGASGMLSGPAGRTFPGEWSAREVRTSDGDALGHVLIMNDVSERLALEAERRQAHKMEALGSLAGGIAHDFNNLLAVMLGHAEMIAESADVHRDDAAQILEAGERARDLVRRILAFSRKDEHRSRRPVDVAALLRESAALLRASLPSVDELVIPEHGALPPVIGDEGELHQVLMNLATNARDAMGEAGGTLTLTVTATDEPRDRVVSHGILRAGPGVCLEVRDSGPGMDAELQRRAFDPFFTTKEPGKGTGMGLSLVYSIVQAHGGAIDLHSEPGAGTRIRIHLPADPTAEIAPVRTPATPARSVRGEGHVLLVDDEEPVRRMARIYLERLGYTTADFARPEDAFEAWQRDPGAFDLVFTDRTMPGMDGIRLCRRLREAGATVPMLLCSGFNEPVDADTHAALAPLWLLSKPYRQAELAAVLDRALRASSSREGDAPRRAVS